MVRIRHTLGCQAHRSGGFLPPTAGEADLEWDGPRDPANLTHIAYFVDQASDVTADRLGLGDPAKVEIGQREPEAGVDGHGEVNALAGHVPCALELVPGIG